MQVQEVSLEGGSATLSKEKDGQVRQPLGFHRIDLDIVISHPNPHSLQVLRQVIEIFSRLTPNEMG